LEVALIRPKDRDAWALPKGLLGPGELPEITALREAREETGLDGVITGKIGNAKYTYTAKWANPPERVFKIVTFYLMKYQAGDTAGHDWEVQKVAWFPLDQAIKAASYSTEKEILRKARDMLGQTPGEERRGDSTKRD
jgi:8-oxo-dGTP pyrophosphatase MutT (NUDIX family)